MPDPRPLVENVDYTVAPDGRWVFTASFLRTRGRCCGSGCRNCPYPADERERARTAQAAQRDPANSRV